MQMFNEDFDGDGTVYDFSVIAMPPRPSVTIRANYGNHESVWSMDGGEVADFHDFLRRAMHALVWAVDRWDVAQ